MYLLDFDRLTLDKVDFADFVVSRGDTWTSPRGIEPIDIIVERDGQFIAHNTKTGRDYYSAGTKEEVAEYLWKYLEDNYNLSIESEDEDPVELPMGEWVYRTKVEVLSHLLDLLPYYHGIAEHNTVSMLRWIITKIALD